MKNKRMFDEIVAMYHPDYKDLTKNSIRLFSSRTDDLNIEKMVEESFAPRHLELCRKRKTKIMFEHVERGHHLDLSDGSDVKCISLTERDQKDGKVQKATLSVRSTEGGKAKKGAIRLVLWNSILKQIEYYYLPKHAWEKWATQSKTINLNAPKHGIIRKIQKFRVNSFDDLVMMNENKMNKQIENSYRNLVRFFKEAA